MWQSKKIFVGLLLAVLLLPLAVNATVSRLEGLGGSGDAFWWYVPGTVFVLHDAATPSIWPQLIQQYPNQAGGEFHDGTGGWDLEKMYVTYSFGEKKHALQLSMDRINSMRYFNTTATPMPGVPSRLNLLWGMKMGETMLLGAALSYAGRSFETVDDPATTTVNESSTLSASVIGLKVGLSGTGDTEWDAVLGLELPSFTDEAGGATLSEDDGSMGIHAAGRFWWNYSETTSLIPNLRFNTYTDAATYPGTPATGTSINRTQIGVGVGHNWWPIGNTLVLTDFGILMQTHAYEFTGGGTNFDRTDHALPYWRIGFETTVFNWLDGRLGAERFWSTMEDQSFPTEPTISTSATNTFIGATTHWNRMILDMVMNPFWFEDGLYFISGMGNPLLWRLSLKYDFNEE